MSTIRPLILGSILVFLSGCAVFGGERQPCGSAGAYMHAEAESALTVPEGLDRVAESRRVTVPTGADVVHPELRGQRVETGDGGWHCLDQPPPKPGLGARRR